MARKLKIFISMAGFALLIVIALFAYNRLAAQVNPALRPALPEAQDFAFAQRQRAPDFSFTDRDGNSLTFSGIVADGKPIVLNFWASWCPACRNETPGFERVYRDFGGEVKFIMLNLTDGVRETVATAQRYIDEGGFTLPVYFDTLQDGAITYGIRFIPATVFIDRDGYIVTAIQGAVDEDTLREIVDFIRVEGV